MDARTARPLTPRSIVAGVTSVICTLAVTFGLALAQAAGLGAAEAPQHADAAVVLGAAVWAHGRPSPVLARRTRAAGRLYQEGRVRWVATTGGTGRHAPTEGDAAGKLLVDEGLVDAEHIVVENRSRTTLENLMYLRPALLARGVRSLFVVSDGYHLARGVRMAQDLGFVAAGIAANGSVLDSVLHAPDHWLGEARLLMIYALARPAVR
jgi:uncharacterized SAM-binding protein YcdF (DUF218 family)